MNLLLLGNGGREHALAWKLSQSNLLSKLWIAPGNAGTSQYGTNIALNINDFDTIASFATANKVDMVVVGPEEPLVNGIHDYFISNPALKGISVIGPVRHGAKLEGSKSFAKKFMFKYGIPTAEYGSFDRNSYAECIEYLENIKPPYVLKADGLAGGKGVIITESLKEAKAEITKVLIENKFGEAGSSLVIEQFLSGIELSVFVLTDGKTYMLLPEAKDYKRIGEGDTGLNTGGMGAISPVPFVDATFMKKVTDRIIVPTIHGLIEEKIDYRGFIFFGLMNVDGDPYVIEYNTRLGDPEAEAIIPRITNDLLEIFDSVAKQRLDDLKLIISSKYSATVILASGGYPSEFERGLEILGIEKEMESLVFQAGTLGKENGSIVTSGGRVMAVTSLAASLKLALETSYKTIEKISFKNKYYRKDIGQDLLKYKQ